MQCHKMDDGAPHGQKVVPPYMLWDSFQDSRENFRLTECLGKELTVMKEKSQHGWVRKKVWVKLDKGK